LDLLILQTLQTIGAMHGWGIARRIERISEDQVSLNYGTVYPGLIRLEQKGWIKSSWGISENNRRAKFYKLSSQGQSQLKIEKRSWKEITAFVSRVLEES
jgi:PadR family transcriptional regulator